MCRSSRSLRRSRCTSHPCCCSPATDRCTRSASTTRSRSRRSGSAPPRPAAVLVTAGSRYSRQEPPAAQPPRHLCAAEAADRARRPRSSRSQSRLRSNPRRQKRSACKSQLVAPEIAVHEPPVRVAVLPLVCVGGGIFSPGTCRCFQRLAFDSRAFHGGQRQIDRCRRR